MKDNPDYEIDWELPSMYTGTNHLPTSDRHISAGEDVDTGRIHCKDKGSNYMTNLDFGPGRSASLLAPDILYNFETVSAAAGGSLRPVGCCLAESPTNPTNLYDNKFTIEEYTSIYCTSTSSKLDRVKFKSNDGTIKIKAIDLTQFKSVLVSDGCVAELIGTDGKKIALARISDNLNYKENYNIKAFGFGDSKPEHINCYCQGASFKRVPYSLHSIRPKDQGRASSKGCCVSKGFDRGQPGICIQDKGILYPGDNLIDLTSYKIADGCIMTITYYDDCAFSDYYFLVINGKIPLYKIEWDFRKDDYSIPEHMKHMTPDCLPRDYHVSLEGFGSTIGLNFLRQFNEMAFDNYTMKRILFQILLSHHTNDNRGINTLFVKSLSCLCSETYKQPTVSMSAGDTHVCSVNHLTSMIRADPLGLGLHAGRKRVYEEDGMTCPNHLPDEMLTFSPKRDWDDRRQHNLAYNYHETYDGQSVLIATESESIPPKVIKPDEMTPERLPERAFNYGRGGLLYCWGASSTGALGGGLGLTYAEPNHHLHPVSGGDFFSMADKQIKEAAIIGVV
eukprot:GHVR01170827.1.p1 GENE.GHVR01170827.1~~GHVR01170827.1.p1  ORF type:complete len:562 (-),score=72.35 GHVR01170827.1:456-2141(-)